MRPSRALPVLAACLVLARTVRASAEDTPPLGPRIDRAARPALDPGAQRACSFRIPLCVHAARDILPNTILQQLAAAERAWDVLTGALALPPPDPDPVTGAFDVFLVAHEDDVAAALLDRRVAWAAFDRASAFVLLEAGARGCARDTAITRALARAILFRVSPATDAGSATAESAYFARLAVPCAMGEVLGAGAFQSEPERVIFDAEPDASPRAAAAFAQGASLFDWWLDYSFSNAPGAMVRALWALSPTKTPPLATAWTEHPSGLDVLRVTFKDALLTSSTLDDLWVDFAVARAFFGDADDGAHLPESRSLGPSGLVRFDWRIDWPKKPRALASAFGVAPTGAAYVAIDRAGAPPGARLRVEASWEEHAKMRWSVVKVDEHGRELGHVAIPTVDRATSAQMTVVDLDAARTIYLVGTNVGDPFLPLDLSDAVWEPHGWTLTVAAE